MPWLCWATWALPASVVASNYLSVFGDLASEKGAEFAIAYDRDLRRHLKSEVEAVADVAFFLNALDDARASAMQRTLDQEKAEKTEKARRSAQAAGGEAGGKGSNNGPSGRERRRKPRPRPGVQPQSQPQ